MIDHQRLCRWAFRWLLAAFMLGMTVAWAQSSVAELLDVQADRREGAIYLSAQMKLELAPAVEDALVKGLAVHFVAEAEVMRDRWYWYDRKLGLSSRYYRLAFQPLTRKWRLNVSSEPLSGGALAGSISQSFDALRDALDVVRRQSGWKVAELKDLDPEARQYIAYRFKLDVTQLPRPFQLAAGNQADWNLAATRQIRLNPDLLQ